MSIAAFSVNHVCPFKYRTRHSEIEQNSDLHLAWRKIKKENKMPLTNHKIAPPPPPPPATMLDTCTRYFSKVSTLYWGWGGGGGEQRILKFLFKNTEN